MEEQRPISRRDLISRINRYAELSLQKVREETGLRRWNYEGEYGFEKDGEIYEKDASQMVDFARNYGLMRPEERLANEGEESAF